MKVAEIADKLIQNQPVISYRATEDYSMESQTMKWTNDRLCQHKKKSASFTCSGANNVIIVVRKFTW